MKKFLFSLMLVTAMTCEGVETKGDAPWSAIYRCENKEVICYVISGIKRGGISCKFKEQSDE